MAGPKAKTPRTPREKAPRGAPIGNDNHGSLRQQLAPYPLVDRYPQILAGGLSLNKLAAFARIAQQGYRQQLVDAQAELLEKDPHAFAVLQQRALAAVGGRIELVPAEVADPESPEAKRAEEIAHELQRRLDAIPAKATAFYSLVFSGLYYAVGGLEILWDVRADGWWVKSLEFIHSRRISYPDMADWGPHIWDQGSVNPFGWNATTYPTQNFFGLPVRSAPGKFLIHTPRFRADYTTREGLGHIIMWWMGLKLAAARGAGEFVERFSKPWALAYYATGEEGLDAKPRAATGADITAANNVLAAIGLGGLSGAALPDSIRVQLLGPGMSAGTGITQKELIALCDEQTSKAVRGGTLTTDAGTKGARSLGEVHEEGDVRNARFDATTLAETLRGGNEEETGGLIWWLCHLNYPGEEALTPSVKVHVEKIDPDAILERAVKLAGVNAPVDGRKISEITGVPLVRPDDPDAIRLATLKPTDLFALLPAAAHDLPNALEAIAAMTGIALTPAMKSAIAEMDRDAAARVLQALLGAAKQDVKDTSAEGVAADAPAPDGEAAPPPRGPRAAAAQTPEEAPTKRGPNPSGKAAVTTKKPTTKPAAKRRGAVTATTEE